MLSDAPKAGEAFTLHIYGTYLQDSRGVNTKVGLNGETGIEGIPVSACHLKLDIPSGHFAAPTDVEVVVVTGQQSSPAMLRVR